MTDMQSGIVALLRADFGEEVGAGFPHLRTIPQTKVVQFLDYSASLGPDDQSALLDALALRGSVLFDLRAGAAFPPAPAFDRYWSAVTSHWSEPGGWDYITEENAARVIGLLPELVDYLIGLTEQAVPRR